MKTDRSKLKNSASQLACVDNNYMRGYHFSTDWAEECDCCSPVMELMEKKDGYELIAETPGLSKDELDISLSGHIFTLRGNRKGDKKDKDEGVMFCDSFEEEIMLPDDIAPEKISAHYANGLLDVSIPKSHISESKKIEIN